MSTTATATATKKPKNYGLNKDVLMQAHRENNSSLWKWEIAERITQRYQIPCKRLDEFHQLYGLPRLHQSGSTSIFNVMYSVPALEVILETVPELHS